MVGLPRTRRCRAGACGSCPSWASSGNRLWIWRGSSDSACTRTLSCNTVT